MDDKDINGKLNYEQHEMIREGMRRNETRRRVQSAQTTTVTDCSILIRMPGLHRHVGDIRQRPKMSNSA